MPTPNEHDQVIETMYELMTPTGASVEQMTEELAIITGIDYPDSLVSFLFNHSQKFEYREPQNRWFLSDMPAEQNSPAESDQSLQLDEQRPLTPNESFHHLRESAVQHIEASYKIAHSAVFAERARLLRTKGVTSQDPFIETTPAFPTSHKLEELERLHPQVVPPGLSQLITHGVPVDRFALYTHQEEALLAAAGDSPNLLVATGTGSGKTEAFLLPILADILREAYGWEAVRDSQINGCWVPHQQKWLHSRTNERRPAALRAIVLYPMNALVNDQLQRLRRILARRSSPDWQRRNLNGNSIHFGMYTSAAMPTGSPSNTAKRLQWDELFESIQQEWSDLNDVLKDSGGWPRPDGTEMICRWDMQAAPPDILVTNYSMLEFMLVRDLESGIFDQTREWLANTPGARLTLVLDEAHTYSGAKGTEVAYLIRRLKQRLGIESDSTKFRAIATTASVPNVSGGDETLKGFVSTLFDEPRESFSLIRVKPQAPLAARVPDVERMRAFASFYENFSALDPMPAINSLARSISAGAPDSSVAPQESLYRLLENDSDVLWLRSRTARNATLLNQLAKECWPGDVPGSLKESATAGILSAGSFARADVVADTPPLISTRLHGFFRGIPGIWACLNPNCSEVDSAFAVDGRPIGKLYEDPRPWCGCGSRVLELFSCRHCGLLYVGGIPDEQSNSLWPWSSDLTEQRKDLSTFRIFGVEDPGPGATVEHRSMRTTKPVSSEDPFARMCFVSEPAKNDDDEELSPYPSQCPRCRNYRWRAAFGEARELVEPLGVRGSRTLSVIVEEAFRIQPRTTDPSPNHGRKALVFSDSRRKAATLAAELREDHTDDLFRQLALRALHSCMECGGTGRIEHSGPFVIGQPTESTFEVCEHCNGSGHVEVAPPMAFRELRNAVIDLQIERLINPDSNVTTHLFADKERGNLAWKEIAEERFNVALRRELSEDQYALEPLALARWRLKLPENIGTFNKLSPEESAILLNIVARILCTEKVLLPPTGLTPWDWPRDIEDDDRNLLVKAYKRNGVFIPFSVSEYRKLGRFLVAVSKRMVSEERLGEAERERWVKSLGDLLWQALTGLAILDHAGGKNNFGHYPFGIRIDRFNLHPIGETVHKCMSCRYVMGDALLNVCSRCGNLTEPVPSSAVKSYFRSAALYALPNSSFDDPYPLRAFEHTAQIGSDEARMLERWFQEFYRRDEHPGDSRVDALSVTTTMEMGIDIGTLLCVAMRNVPPTVANYQQRAGRAGRRGSSIATVLTFSQHSSHDQYYFQRPPEIVSTPPRIPALHVDNDVIARRHVRALVLHSFFSQRLEVGTSGLFEQWGTIGDFESIGGSAGLVQFLLSTKQQTLRSATEILTESLASLVQDWIAQLPGEVEKAISSSSNTPNSQVLDALINAGLLPRYSFPVDVVSLDVPVSDQRDRDYTQGFDSSDSMQRDRKIALAEYGPGAEIVRGQVPNTYVYTSVGLSDPFSRNPRYLPDGKLVRCGKCQAVQLGVMSHTASTCPECGSPDLDAPLPYIKPNGFTVDFGKWKGGRRRWSRGDGERSGSVSPAQLLAGSSSFETGRKPGYSSSLYTSVRVGDLFAFNLGPEKKGYIICPDCGRALNPETLGTHTRPSSVPPHAGRNLGPRAGSQCPNTSSFSNEVILGHNFQSEVLLLGVDLPADLDSPYLSASGKAGWNSFGELVTHSATTVLQIDPGELKVGVRPAHRPDGRIHGEVFLYDDVPGGAGYARAIDQNLEEILKKALAPSMKCDNPECTGACYHCLLDYSNQFIHSLLDRELGGAILEYLLHGTKPNLTPEMAAARVGGLKAYALEVFETRDGIEDSAFNVPLILSTGNDKYGLCVIHPLQAVPSEAARLAFHMRTGLRPAVHNTFDLERRPFWVLNNLAMV